MQENIFKEPIEDHGYKNSHRTVWEVSDCRTLTKSCFPSMAILVVITLVQVGGEEEFQAICASYQFIVSQHQSVPALVNGLDSTHFSIISSISLSQ